MATTRAMRLTSCAASLTRSRTRCGIARTGWNRRTWPTGWLSAAGNWPRASWSISPTSLISWAARPASAPSAPGDDGRPRSPRLPRPDRHRLSQRQAAGARGCLSSALGPEVCRTGERAGVPVRLGGAFKTPRHQIVPTAPGLGGQVGGVGPGKVQRGGDLPGDRDAQAGQLSALVRVVAQQPDAVGAERVQHLGRAGVVALVGPVTEREIRVVRVQTAILQRVGVEFVIQSDAAPFLPQIQQVPAVLGDPLDRFAQLRSAVASLAAEHITGEAFTVQAHQG